MTETIHVVHTQLVVLHVQRHVMIISQSYAVISVLVQVRRQVEQKSKLDEWRHLVARE